MLTFFFVAEQIELTSGFPSQDRLLSLGTGRTVTITDDIIEVPLPAESELAPALNDGNETLPALPNPFCRVVCLFTICGRVSNILVSLANC